MLLSQDKNANRGSLRLRGGWSKWSARLGTRIRSVSSLLRRHRRDATRVGDEEYETERQYQMGRHQLLLPPGHRVDCYQRAWHRFDVALGDIADSVREKYADVTAIDVGANVGATTALICRHSDIPVLAIEGNSDFLPYLRENARRIGSHVEVLECYVGPDDLAVDVTRITASRGTSSAVSAIASGAAAHPARSLSSIVASYPRFGQARLLKIDTDGFDFEIIQSSLNWIASARPVLFFEYDTGIRPEDESRGLLAVAGMMSIGYDRFIVYDNFGNFLVSVCRIDTFAELNAYLRSNRRHGVAVEYFDVCGFHNEDRDVFEAIHNREMAV